MAKRRRNAPRDYPRTARLNELLREIVAAEIDRIDDDRIGWVSISGVDVDNELTKARIYLSSLDDDLAGTVEALEDNKGRIKKAIGEQATIRRVPDLEFITDPAIRSGGRVEEILGSLRDAGELE